VAAGVGEQLVLWDRRTRKIISSFEDTHAQDIIQMKFNPSFPNALISGSEDGSLAVFDVSQVIDEEDSFVGAVSINTSISKIGFYGNDKSSLWCTSGTESVHWWDWKQSCNPESIGGAGVTAEALEPRQRLLVGSRPSDYLISCHYSNIEDSLFTLVGDIHGSVAVYTSFNPQGTSQVAFSSQPLHLLTGGHKDIVRAVVPCTDSMQFQNDIERSPILLSGGEDGRICLWGPLQCEWSETQEHHRQNRASPY
jgi:WD40 repeat protein